MSTEIIELQTQIKELENESNLLTLDYQRQKDIHDILATKYEEVRLTVPSGTSGYVNLVSKASIPEPEDRLPHNTIRNTLVAVLAGGVLGIAAIVIWDWWSCGTKPDPKDEEKSNRVQ